jgi:hypothetical protein
VNNSFKAAVERLADAMLAEMDQPTPDWDTFALRAFRDLNFSQLTEVSRANDLTFQNAIKRAVVRKKAEANAQRKQNGKQILARFY